MMERSGPSNASLNVGFAVDSRFFPNESLGEIEESEEKEWISFECVGRAVVWPRP